MQAFYIKLRHRRTFEGTAIEEAREFFATIERRTGKAVRVISAMPTFGGMLCEVPREDITALFPEGLPMIEPDPTRYDGLENRVDTCEVRRRLESLYAAA